MLRITMTAIPAIALTAGMAFAQSEMTDDQTMDDSSDIQMAENGQMEDGMYSGVVSADDIDNLLRTSNIIGGSIYGLDADYDMAVWDETSVFTEVEAEWEQIANVDDIALSRDGQLTGLIVESGGFLGIGDDTVILEMSDLRLIDDGTGDYAWVTDITEDEIEAMPEVEENWF